MAEWSCGRTSLSEKIFSEPERFVTGLKCCAGELNA